LYLEAQDFVSLRKSIQTYDQFNAIELAQKIESSENIEFRRISAIIFRKNKQFGKSIKVLINDHFFKDAIETVVESQSRELAKNILLYFA
jgi:clathrin heavy chain